MKIICKIEKLVDEIDIDWYFTIIHDFYFDDDYDVNYDINYDNNGESNDIIDDFLINKLEFMCKEIMGGVQEKKIDLVDVYLFF